MDTVVVKIAKDYSSTPGPRYEVEGSYSGEQFRKTKFTQIFREAINHNQKIIVDLDGVVGYGTSFLEEIFGGLIREDHLSYPDIVKKLTIISKEEPYLVEDIMLYLKEAWESGKK